MKTIKLILVLAIAGSINMTAFAQKNNKSGKLATVTIKVTAKCGMCTERIEKALTYEKGIKSAKVDLPSKTVTVTYTVSKTNPDKIRKAITMVGYDADDMPADKNAYEKLPPCCRKEAMDH